MTTRDKVVSIILIALQVVATVAFAVGTKPIPRWFVVFIMSFLVIQMIMDMYSRSLDDKYYTLVRKSREISNALIKGLEEVVAMQKELITKLMKERAK